MKLIINSFPPIVQKCTIDLSKKLILFVGHNNSGKTYITQLIWAINNFNNSSRDFDYLNFKLLKMTYFLEKLESELSNNMSMDSDKLNVSRLFHTTFDFKEKNLKAISKNYSLYLKNEIIDEVFNNKMSADFQILFDIESFENLELKHNIDGGEWILYINKEKNSLKFDFKLEVNNFGNEEEAIPLDLLNQYIEILIISSMVNKNTIFMPSTRSFLPSFYKYIYTLENEHKNNALKNIGLLNKKNISFFKSSYTQPINELIKKLIFELDNPIKTNEYLDKLSNLLDGDISINKPEGIGMAEINYSTNSGKIIPMYLSSSMVNQLSMLYLYFKYWYEEKGSFLLIDEPEMNLHPEKKIEIFEQLLNFASKNKLLIATHSSSMAKSLINYIHLFDLKEKEKAEDLKLFMEENKLNMNLNIELKSNDIGIYYFNGKTIISYKNDDNSNIHFGTFSDIDKLQVKQYEYILDKLDEYDS